MSATKYWAWVLVIYGLWAATAGAQVPPHTMAGGGGISQYGSVRIYATVGQPFVGAVANIWAAPDTVIQSGVGFWFLTVNRSSFVSSVPVPAVVNHLYQNAPNPFNPSTTIRFSLGESGRVRLRLFNLKGQKIADLLDQSMAAGPHSIVFRPTEMASGVYFYQLEIGSFRETRRLLLLK